MECPDKYEKIKENYYRYIYYRITLRLRNRRYVLNHKTVRLLMNIIGLKCMVRIKKYCLYRGDVGKFTKSILKRKFIASKPNKKWVTNVTEFHLHGKKLYLSPVLDLYNGKIIVYNNSIIYMIGINIMKIGGGIWAEKSNLILKV